LHQLYEYVVRAFDVGQARATDYVGAGQHDAGAGRPTPETGVMAHQQALVPLGSETHAGEDVALYANGPGAVKGERGEPETGAQAQQQSLVPLGSETHGGEDVALFATGPGSQRVHGVIEQNVVADIMRKAFGWEED